MESQIVQALTEGDNTTLFKTNEPGRDIQRIVYENGDRYYYVPVNSERQDQANWNTSFRRALEFIPGYLVGHGISSRYIQNSDVSTITPFLTGFLSILLLEWYDVDRKRSSSELYREGRLLYVTKQENATDAYDGKNVVQVSDSCESCWKDYHFNVFDPTLPSILRPMKEHASSKFTADMDPYYNRCGSYIRELEYTENIIPYAYRDAYMGVNHGIDKTCSALKRGFNGSCSALNYGLNKMMNKIQKG